MTDLKAIYTAVGESGALDALEASTERWDKKYPKLSASWRDDRLKLSTISSIPRRSIPRRSIPRRYGG